MGSDEGRDDEKGYVLYDSEKSKKNGSRGLRLGY